MGRVLVTGATGFLGGALMRHLTAMGRDVIGQGSRTETIAPLQAQGFDMLPWRLPDALPSAQSDACGDVDTIVHCAALSAPFGRASAFEAANVDGTARVVDLARGLGVRRFVLISSPSVYFALRDQLDQREDTALPKPFNAYAASKIAAERITLQAPQIGAIVLRPRGIYGAGDQALLPRLLRAATRRPLPLLRDGAARIDLTHVDDVVAAICAAVEAPKSAEGQAYNISGGEILPVTAIAEAACARAGITLRWRKAPLRPALAMAAALEALARLHPRQPEPMITRYGLGLFAFAQSLNLDRARSGLGWQPRITFEEGLDRTFAPKSARL